jgi:hypothetical protein
MNIEIKKHADKIYIAEFDSRYELTMTFVRLQEFYESPVFKGTYFTLEEFMDYWCKEMGNGCFTYTSVWSGFNVPGKIISKFMDLLVKNSSVRKKEFELLKLLNQKLREDNEELENIYLIALSKDSKNNEVIMEHEVAHALYALNKEYKKSIDILIKNLDKKIVKEASSVISKMGYCKEVIKDEMQAYWSTNIDACDHLGIQDQFRENYLKFTGEKNEI